MQRISIIIPIFQHWELTVVLFDALRAQSLSQELWECFIVDNGSDQVPDQSELPDFVTLLECPTPGSYAARNKGLQHAQGELLVFTDADCKPQPDWLERLWHEYQQQSAPQLIAGGVTVKRFLSGTPNAIETYDMAMGLPQARYIQRGYAVTANLSIPRRVFDAIGNFDDQRFSGGDAEICRRAAANGFTLTYLPNAEVLHPARDSWEELITKLKRQKGGQVRSGPKKQRVKFIIKTLIPPVWLFWYAMRSDKITSRQKITVLRVQTLLWLVEISETARLLANGKLERR
ncbi:glycosyltransferase [Alcanivorax sp. DP30]|nr:glycosyltransferase [Alcanivorax sp. DP30]